MISDHLMLDVTMLDKSILKHEVAVRVHSDPVDHCLVMISGISRDGENDKSYNVEGSSPLWLDGPGKATFRSAPTGLGKSEGDTFSSTLRDRVELIKVVAQKAKELYPTSKLTLVGSSMGGHVAVRAAALLKTSGIEIYSLLLSSPCFYNDRSETATYGANFKQAANIDNSNQSISEYRVMGDLKDFPGRVFIFYQGYENDLTKSGVVGMGDIIMEVDKVMIKRARDGKRDEYFTVDGGEHTFKTNGVNPSPETIQSHAGSAMKNEVSRRALKFLETTE